jgi:beta-1,4-mannosyltransferase
VRVLTHPHFAGVRPNPTVKLLVNSLPSDIEAINFSWKSALWGDYDILHVHWPEALLRARGHPRLSRKILFFLLLLRLTLRRTPSVWTVHDERPHDSGSWDQSVLLSLWGRLVTRRVFMFDVARPTPGSHRDVVIPRGDYAALHPLSADARRENIIPGRLLILGFIRPYKGIEEFLSTFAASAGSNLSLVIAGQSLSPKLTENLRRLCGAMPRVDLRTDYLSDTEIEELVVSSEAVILPYRAIYNSGVALLALTLKRPIIVQRSRTMEELAGEVKGSWVTLFDIPATGENFLTAYHRALTSHEQSPPDMSRRHWPDVGHKYASLYRSLL